MLAKRAQRSKELTQNTQTTAPNPRHSSNTMKLLLPRLVRKSFQHRRRKNDEDAKAEDATKDDPGKASVTDFRNNRKSLWKVLNGGNYKTNITYR